MSSQLKQRFLKLLKEDEEFRYAVAGLLGLEEILKRLDRHEEQLVKLREDMNRGFELIERRISALGARWGLQTEEAFREGLKGILEKEFGVKIERWIEKDKEGMVYDHPSDVELDVVKDGKTMLIEVSSHVKASDIPIFRRKAEFYEKITGVRADRLVIVTPYADDRALEMAKEFGIEIYTKV
ncbi:PD-(D/E)XK nuclease family protein [Candidatus Methanodesulfokora washburnensis]|uniref:DUF3782 domain-containing protein n=1 Tax=Candidatus Methanodesulfokora washburnensis TaxID=2478471 RepID=A0A3R9PBD3_9CREN|nr:DUF3782 domain-containing protein [Candidatus Methanodesulfokores washburnensis]RSN71243.1 DUF3782 domain-containing protein [Candidatus Methanodesulfokores washburnensis]